MANPHMLVRDPRFDKVFNSVKRLDEKGRLYSVDYDQNCYELTQMIDMLVAGAGCSTFTAKNVAGEQIMGRNYDYSHYRYNKRTEETTPKDVTGLGVVVKYNNPAAKHKSIGVADGFWMDVQNGSMFEGMLDDGKTDVSALALIPFLCMDGLNDAGLAVSIMMLPTENRWDEIDYVDPATFDYETKLKSEAFIFDEPGKVPEVLAYKAQTGTICVNTADHKAWKPYKNFAVWQKEEGKQTVFHPVLMRLMLDNCSCAEEAIGLAQSVNVRSALPDDDYHIMVSDASGKSFILEWINNELKFAPCDHATNFHCLREDHYGAGFERDNILAAAKEKYKPFGMPESIAKCTLQMASQNSLDGSDKGFTQWSSLYNLAKGTLTLWHFNDFEKKYEFTVK